MPNSEKEFFDKLFLFVKKEKNEKRNNKWRKRKNL